jgi:hypothetical protein
MAFRTADNIKVRLPLASPLALLCSIRLVLKRTAKRHNRSLSQAYQSKENARIWHGCPPSEVAEPLFCIQAVDQCQVAFAEPAFHPWHRSSGPFFGSSGSGMAGSIGTVGSVLADPSKVPHSGNSVDFPLNPRRGTWRAECGIPVCLWTLKKVNIQCLKIWHNF